MASRTNHLIQRYHPNLLLSHHDRKMTCITLPKQKPLLQGAGISMQAFIQLYHQQLITTMTGDPGVDEIKKVIGQKHADDLMRTGSFCVSHSECRIEHCSPCKLSYNDIVHYLLINARLQYGSLRNLDPRSPFKPAGSSSL